MNVALTMTVTEDGKPFFGPASIPYPNVKQEEIAAFVGLFSKAKASFAKVKDNKKDTVARAFNGKLSLVVDDVEKDSIPLVGVSYGSFHALEHVAVGIQLALLEWGHQYAGAHGLMTLDKGQLKHLLQLKE